MGKKPTYEELEREIKELKAKASALKESEIIYCQLVENISDTVWKIDLKTLQFTYVNQAYKHVSGFSEQEIKNSHLEELFTPESFKLITDALDQELIEDKSGRAKPRRLELEHRHKNGSIFIAEVSARFVRDAKGRPCSIAGVTRDITKQKQFEEELRQKEKTIQKEKKSLQEINTALKVLLEKRTEDKLEFEDNILKNVKILIDPYISKLKNTKLRQSQEIFLDIIENNIKEIVSPFANRLSTKLLNLSSKEIQVADHIKNGKTNKEIADIFNVSKRTIEFHRENIRKKIGIKNKKLNLKTYLLSLS